MKPSLLPGFVPRRALPEGRRRLSSGKRNRAEAASGLAPDRRHVRTAPTAWETFMSFFIGIACPWLIVSGLMLMWHRRAEEIGPKRD